MNRHIMTLLSLPKSLYYNFKIFGFKIGIRTPLLIAFNVKIKGAYKGCIKIPPQLAPFSIKFGINSGSLIDGRANLSIISFEKGTYMKFLGSADFKSGIIIILDRNGCIEIGNNFSCNKNCKLSSDCLIKFGDDCLLGWEVNLRTSDGHFIYSIEDKINPINKSVPVIIGNHVWLCSYVDVLKGVNIPDNCVIGYRSCVAKSFNEPNSIIAGSPAKIIKHAITWER